MVQDAMIEIVITGIEALAVVMIVMAVETKTTETKVISQMIGVEVVTKIGITQEDVVPTQIVLQIAEMILVHIEAQDQTIRTIIETSKELLSHLEMIEVAEISHSTIMITKEETITKVNIIIKKITITNKSREVIDQIIMTTTIKDTVMSQNKEIRLDLETEINNSNNLSSNNKTAEGRTKEIEEEIETKVITVKEIINNVISIIIIALKEVRMISSSQAHVKVVVMLTATMTIKKEKAMNQSSNNLS